MGIRFSCPNGHRLNVKTFLAGRRGICPFCGAKFTIPSEDTAQPGGAMPDAPEVSSEAAAPPSSAANPATQFERELERHIQAAEDLAPQGPAEPRHGKPSDEPILQATMPSMPVAVAPSASVAAEGGAGASRPAEPQQPISDSTARPTRAPDASPSGQPGMEQPSPPQPSAPPPPPISDPLAEAPTAVWYVRPPSGGQFGPAQPDLLQNWLNEGRISHDTLVWREGWADWREAASVFPSLEPASSPATEPPLVAPASALPAGGLHPGARRRSGPNLGLIVMLALATLFLLVIFLWILQGGLSQRKSAHLGGPEVSRRLSVLLPKSRLARCLGDDGAVELRSLN